MSKRAFVETCVHREILTFNFFYLRKREKKSFECFSLSIINIFMNISKKYLLIKIFFSRVTSINT